MRTSTKFARDKLPNPRSFYSQEFGRIGREDGRGWVRVKKCPEHGGSGFGVNLRTGAFNCFNCGLKGSDVLAFYIVTRKVNFVTAYTRLGAGEDDLNPSESKRQRRREADYRLAEAARQQQAAEQARRRRIEARNWLHLLERIYARSNDRLSVILRDDAKHQHDSEAETLWGILSDLLPQIRAAASAYRQLAGVADGD